MKKFKSKKVRVIKSIICVFILLIITSAIICITNIFDRKNIILVTYDGTVNDEGFNKQIWSGLSKLKYKANISYVENTEGKDFRKFLEDVKSKEPDLIICSESSGANIVYDFANQENSKTKYIIIDYDYDKPLDNLASLKFNSYEASFLAGYVAGKKTQTNTVGFVGGKNETVINEFEKGYIAGVKYANLGCNVVSTYTESYSDEQAGIKAAKNLFAVNADIIFHASGVCGKGVIKESVSQGKFAIGVDIDQSYLAKGTVITSVLKNLDKSIVSIVNDYIKGVDMFGKTYTYGLKDSGVSIVKDKDTLGNDLIKEINELENKIINNKLDVKKLVFENKI